MSIHVNFWCKLYSFPINDMQFLLHIVSRQNREWSVDKKKLELIFCDFRSNVNIYKFLWVWIVWLLIINIKLYLNIFAKSGTICIFLRFRISECFKNWLIFVAYSCDIKNQLSVLPAPDAPLINIDCDLLCFSKFNNASFAEN